MATVTRQTIRRYMLDHFELGKRCTNDATQSGATTLSDDSQLGGPGGQENIENGCEVWVTQDSTAGGGGTIRYGLSRISKRPTLSGGTITLDPGINSLDTNIETPVVANNDTDFEVIYRPWRIDDIHECINQALLEYVPEKIVVPFSQFTDADMLSTVTTSWTGTDSSLSKVAASASAPMRQLLVLATAAPGYALQTTNVLENETYYLEATAASASGSSATTGATLRLMNNTASTEFTLQEYTTDVRTPAYVTYQNTVQIPADTLTVEVRLQTDTLLDGSLWSNILFYPMGRKELSFPDRMEPDRIGKIYYRIGNEYRDYQLVEINGRVEQRTEGIYVLNLEEPPRFPVFYEDFTKRTTLTADTSTTSATTEEVAAVASWLLLRQKENTERWHRQFLKARDRASGFLLKRRATERTYKRVPYTHSMPAV